MRMKPRSRLPFGDPSLSALQCHYLRGVSFPISKQDLLMRYARASNAGSDVLDAIDGLADRSYASASDVLAAVEVVH